MGKNNKNQEEGYGIRKREESASYWTEIDVGEDYCIPPTFRREHQFMVYLLRTTEQTRHMVFSSSDWTLLLRHRGSAYLNPLTTGLIRSPTGRIISPSKLYKTIKEQKFWIILFI